jgi:hypothetical protein
MSTGSDFLNNPSVKKIFADLNLPKNKVARDLRSMDQTAFDALANLDGQAGFSAQDAGIAAGMDQYKNNKDEFTWASDQNNFNTLLDGAGANGPLTYDQTHQPITLPTVRPTP